MDIVKKNFVSVIFGVVALVAFIAYFWPIGSMYGDLQSKVEERQRVHGTLRALQEKPRKLPIIDPDNPQAEQLERFPSKTIIETGQQATQRVEQESARLRDTAVAMNRREPLVRGAFPNVPSGAGISFRNAYRIQMNRVLPEDLQAGRPPDQETITRALAEMEREMDLRAVRVDGQIIQPEQHQRAVAERRVALPQQLRARVAQRNLMYLMPDALVWHSEFEPGRGAEMAPAPEDVWYAQVGLWVQRDIVDAIAAANEGATSVVNAPIKRLVRVELGTGQAQGGRTSGPAAGLGSHGNNLYLLPARTAGAGPGGMGMGGMNGMGMGPGMGGMGAAAAETPATADFDSPLQPDYTVSPTGRVSNGMYDLVPFRISVVVEADKIPLIMHELGRGRFIYVRRIEQLEAVDSALEQAEGFIYGDRPVALLTLDCEALFLRAWTLEMMPRPVRDLLLANGQVAGRM